MRVIGRRVEAVKFTCVFERYSARFKILASLSYKDICADLHILRIFLFDLCYFCSSSRINVHSMAPLSRKT